MGEHIASRMFKPKGEKKNITLVLDEGEGIIESIKKAMAHNSIKECTILDMEGKIKEATIKIFEENSFKPKKCREMKVMHASGNYKLSFGELFGSVSIALGEKPPITGTLLSGKAGNNLQIKISFKE